MFATAAGAVLPLDETRANTHLTHLRPPPSVGPPQVRVFGGGGGGHGGGVGLLGATCCCAVRLGHAEAAHAWCGPGVRGLHHHHHQAGILHPKNGVQLAAKGVLVPGQPHLVCRVKTFPVRAIWVTHMYVS